MAAEAAVNMSNHTALRQRDLVPEEPSAMPCSTYYNTGEAQPLLIWTIDVEFVQLIPN